MKKIRMGFVALAALTGIGNAYAFNHHKSGGTTYYGYKDAMGNERWALTPPHGYTCQPNGIACTITSTAAQSVVLGTENALPPSSTVGAHANESFQPSN